MIILQWAIEHAKGVSANAIRFDSNVISDVMQEILVYRTAAAGRIKVRNINF